MLGLMILLIFLCLLVLMVRGRAIFLRLLNLLVMWYVMGFYRSHALRGNAALDAPRPESEPPLNQPLATSAINDAERQPMHFHAERGNDHGGCENETSLS